MEETERTILDICSTITDMRLREDTRIKQREGVYDEILECLVDMHLYLDGLSTLGNPSLHINAIHQQIAYCAKLVAKCRHI